MPLVRKEQQQRNRNEKSEMFDSLVIKIHIVFLVAVSHLEPHVST